MCWFLQLVGKFLLICFLWLNISVSLAKTGLSVPVAMLLVAELPAIGLIWKNAWHVAKRLCMGWRRVVCAANGSPIIVGPCLAASTNSLLTVLAAFACLLSPGMVSAKSSPREETDFFFLCKLVLASKKDDATLSTESGTSWRGIVNLRRAVRLPALKSLPLLSANQGKHHNNIFALLLALPLVIGFAGTAFLLQPWTTWLDIYGKATARTWPFTTVGCWLDAVAAALAMSNRKPRQAFLLFLLRSETIAIGFCPVQVGLHFPCCFVASPVGYNNEFPFAVTGDAAFGEAHKTCQEDQGFAASAGFLGRQSGLLAAAAKLFRFLLSLARSMQPFCGAATWFGHLW